jgi:hypothetical protein
VPNNSSYAMRVSEVLQVQFPQARLVSVDSDVATQSRTAHSCDRCVQLKETPPPMRLPIKVTFDKNTYEFVVFPDKKSSQKSQEDENSYYKINSTIKSGYIEPFLSETILTIETIDSKDRKNTLSRKDRLKTTDVVDSVNGNSISSTVTIKPNEEVYPANHDHFYIYLPKAIELGFKILPSYRLGKITNPAITSDLYYTPKTTDIFEIPNKFSSIVGLIEDKGFGFSALRKLLGINDSENKSWIYFLDKYTGSDKQLQKMVAEWSDADSVAINIACGIKYFCTNDGAKRNKTNSVFSKEMKTILRANYDIEFVTPIELAKMID